LVHSAWQTLFTGGSLFQTQPGVLNLSAYTFYYFMATGVTPAMEEKMVGRGSQYAWAAHDANGNPLDGGKNSGCTYRQTFRSRSSGRLSFLEVTASIVR
jgi:hypothetical protein